MQFIQAEAPYPPNITNDKPETFPVLIFKSATFRQTFGRQGFMILMFCFLLMFLTMGLSLGLVLTYREEYIALAILAIPVVIVIGWIFILSRGYGRIVLQPDRLVSYNYLNMPWECKYTQILEVKKGKYADQSWIRYYPIGKNREIDCTHVRWKYLVSVYN